MNLQDKGVLLTGATGGIGSELVALLVEQGARLVLTGRTQAELDTLKSTLPSQSEIHLIPADLNDPAQRNELIAQAEALLQGIDVAVLSAGGILFDAFVNSPAESIEALIQINLISPMLMTHGLLPAMQERGTGQIVLVGSILGAIGMPYYASYSASKAGLQRFAEALRRELDGSGVSLSLVAPRATDTGLNDPRSREMHAATGTKVDSAEWVAVAILKAIQQQKAETNLGWPERFFVKLNALFPGLVDGALIKQGRTMRKFIQ